MLVCEDISKANGTAGSEHPLGGLMMSRIGILGGTRFVGYHLATCLLNAGHHVTLFNRGKTSPPGPFPLFVEYVHGDRNNPSDIANFFRSTYDVVVDLSGYSPDHVQPLLLEQHRSKVHHYIFCSTSSVYTIPPPCPFSERAPRTTIDKTYGGDKARIEDLLLETWHKSGWPVTILRPQGVFGRFDARQAAFVFSRLLNSAPIFLGQRRDYRINFLYINDLVRAFVQVMRRPLSYGKVYNVAGDDVVTQVQFVHLCAQASSLEAKIRMLEDPIYHHLPVGIPWLGYDLIAANASIKQELGLRFTPLEKALKETWAWVQNEPQHLTPQLFRGEQYLRENRRIPFWVKASWRLEDLVRSSLLRHIN